MQGEQFWFAIRGQPFTCGDRLLEPKDSNAAGVRLRDCATGAVTRWPWLPVLAAALRRGGRLETWETLAPPEYEGLVRLLAGGYILPLPRNPVTPETLVWADLPGVWALTGLPADPLTWLRAAPPLPVCHVTDRAARPVWRRGWAEAGGVAAHLTKQATGDPPAAHLDLVIQLPGQAGTEPAGGRGPTGLRAARAPAWVWDVVPAWAVGLLYPALRPGAPPAPLQRWVGGLSTVRLDRLGGLRLPAAYLDGGLLWGPDVRGVVSRGL